MLTFFAQAAGQCTVFGLSSDTKPSVGTSNGFGFVEIDTGQLYYCNGATWDAVGGSSGASWGTITGTLSSQTDLQTALDGKQDDLVSGTNIKTINGASVLGSGDLVVSGAAKRTIGMVFDGGGSPPTVSSVGYIVAQFSGTIDQWSVVSDVSGSAVIDVWKAAGAIPTIANTIAGSEKPTLSSQQLNSDTSLTTWTTTVTAGDVFGFNIDSVTTCTRLTVEVRIQES